MCGSGGVWFGVACAVWWFGGVCGLEVCVVWRCVWFGDV